MDLLYFIFENNVYPVSASNRVLWRLSQTGEGMCVKTSPPCKYLITFLVLFPSIRSVIRYIYSRLCAFLPVDKLIKASHGIE